MKKFIGIISALSLMLSANVALAKKPVPKLINLMNVVTVSAENGNFTSPIDAINSIIDASETNPYLIQIGPGVYDLGADALVMKNWVSIQGSGQEVTKITGHSTLLAIVHMEEPSSGALQGVYETALTDLTIGTTDEYASAGAAINIAEGARVRIERVTAIATGTAVNVNGIASLVDVIAIATRPGGYTVGVRIEGGSLDNVIAMSLNNHTSTGYGVLIVNTSSGEKSFGVNIKNSELTGGIGLVVFSFGHGPTPRILNNFIVGYSLTEDGSNRVNVEYHFNGHAFCDGNFGYDVRNINAIVEVTCPSHVEVTY